jgi:hypothetical protein
MSAPSWPDAEEWRAALTERLRARASVYEEEPDPLLRRNKAIAFVAEISTFLKAMPGIKDSDLYPLKDLFIFSQDLDHGRSHPWSHPVSVGGTNYESAAKTEVRIWVVLTALVLIEAGYRPKAADQKVSQLLNASGREVGWRTIQRWRLAHEKGDDPRLGKVQDRYDQFWANLDCPHGSKMKACQASGGDRCIFFGQVAEEFARWAFRLPAFRDWFIS